MKKRSSILPAVDCAAEGAHGYLTFMRLLAKFDLGVLLRYLAVGGASALVEFVIFNALFYWVALPILVANLAATCLVIAFGYFCHKHFTFRNQDAYARQIWRYGVMISVSILLNNFLLYLFAVVLDWPPPVAKFLQLGLCFVWNFSCARLHVFAVKP